MKNVSKKFVLTILLSLFAFSMLLAGVPKKSEDPRIQNRDNMVTIAILNLTQDKYKVRIYSSHNHLVLEEKLTNKLHLAGKIFDFNYSAKDYYRILVVSKGRTILERRLFLGN